MPKTEPECGSITRARDQQLLSFNGQSIWPRPSAVRFAYSDASGTGYGGYIVEHGNLVANGQWSEDDAAPELYMA